MYSLFDYYFTPPTRTVYVVSEEQLDKLKLTQVQDQIKECKSQLDSLESAYNRRRGELTSTISSLEEDVKRLEPAKTDG